MAVKKQTEKNGMAVINEHIKNNSFARIYLLYGNEKYLINQYRDKLLDAITDINDTMNFAKYIGEKTDTAAVVDFCETFPFLAERRVVLIEGSGLFKTSCEAFAEKLKNIPDTSIVVFAETEIDKRNKLFKTVSSVGEALCFDTPDDRTMAIWIRSQVKAVGKEIEDAAVFLIMEAAASDMMCIKNEIEKVICYAYDRERITIADVKNVCITGSESKVFDMMEAIARRNQTKAIHLYHELLDNREPAMRILFLIVRQFDMMLKTKLCLAEGKNDAQTASVIGVPAWSVKKYRDQCSYYSVDEIKCIVDQCQNIDYRIKTGQTTDIIAIELLIVDLSKAK